MVDINSEIDGLEKQKIFKDNYNNMSVSLELQMSYGYLNLPVKTALNFGSEDKGLHFESIVYHFDQPVVIDLSVPKNIAELEDTEDFFPGLKIF